MKSSRYFVLDFDWGPAIVSVDHYRRTTKKYLPIPMGKNTNAGYTQALNYRQALALKAELEQAAMLPNGQVELLIFFNGPEHDWYPVFSTSTYVENPSDFRYNRFSLGKFPDINAAQAAFSEWEAAELKSCEGSYCYSHDRHYGQD